VKSAITLYPETAVTTADGFEAISAFFDSDQEMQARFRVVRATAISDERQA
jgi:hypothetical protein